MLNKIFLFTITILSFINANAQLKDNTQIRGFMDVNGVYNQNSGHFDFVLGEQDLFITSDISDKVSFLGETVFKYSSTSSSNFTIGLERAIITYNFKGNHSFFAGKVHTALNYWNDSYHHGRLFFPTVGRPEMFNQGIIPIHTTGAGIQGQNLGKMNFGYTAMIGNGIGSTDVADNDNYKAYVLALHIKPIEGVRFGVSVYYDKISDVPSHSHGAAVSEVHHVITQKLFSGSIAYFKDKIEILTEATIGMNGTDSISDQTTIAAYFYAGYKIKDVLVPYVRADFLQFDKNEMYFNQNKTNAYVGGIRYEINYLTVVKAEYQYIYSQLSGKSNKFIVQIAVGF